MGNTDSNILPNPPEIHLSDGNDEIFHPAPLPLDSDGFVVSFNVQQQEEIFANEKRLKDEQERLRKEKIKKLNEQISSGTKRTSAFTPVRFSIL